MPRISRSNTKLMVRPARDLLGNKTGGTRARPEFDVMTTPDVVAANGLSAYRHTPTYIDEVWCGDDPANPTQTAYLRFTTEAEYEAKVGKFLKSQAPA